ncbi:MAG: hypothetical protein ACJAT2_001193 [Bacteriovoracaceae bacterium]|jgi:hypothetical protein
MEFLKYIFLVLIFISNTTQAGDISGLQFFKDNPSCKAKNNYLYLSKKKAEYIGSRIIKRYQLNCPGSQSTGYLLSDKIRTHYQTLFTIVKDKKIQKIEVLNFQEPAKYRAPLKWLELMFYNKFYDEKKVDSLTGATLTTQSVKRILKKIKNLQD